MRRSSGCVLVLCALALLVMQAAGLHLHVGPSAEGVDLHAEHVHVADPDGHDHSADRDVNIVELGSLWGKLLEPPGTGIALPGRPLLRWFARSRIPQSPVPASRGRLRPPLRAPPARA